MTDETTTTDSDIRVRFAPSPTGYLHTGGARTALFNWLFARKQGGSFILRIEDTDEKRSTPENTQAILDSLRWLGLAWDEGPEVGGDFGPYFQSERKELHLKYADRLWKDGYAYYCDCPTEEAEGKAGRKSAAVGTPGMPLGRCACAERPLSEQLKLLSENPNMALKLKVEPGKEIKFTDLIRGELSFNTDDIGDLVIVKSSGSPTYNFACVVDDATMEISHVIRGEDHISNTPKQLLIYEMLGLKPPQFAHLPLILGMDRARLSKRHGATSVGAYRELGILPEALVNFLLLIGWNPKDEKEEFTRDEMIDAFDLSGIGKAGGVFNPDKLFWFNGRYIRALSDEEYLKRIFEFVPGEWKKKSREDYIAKVMLLLKDRVTHFAEIGELTWYFFRAPADDDFNPETWEQVMKGEQVPMVLKEIPQLLKGIEEFTVENIEPAVRAYAKEKGLKLGEVIQPVRVAITGDRYSPSFFHMAEILGASEIARRAQFALDRLMKS